jgi:integral membrane protein
VTEPRTEATSAQAATAIRKARGALARYRFMAIFTGVMLLLLTAWCILKYVFGAWWGLPVDGFVDATWIVAPVHGWVYVVYLITVLQAWSTMRWGWGRLVTMVLAGVVPVMSFIVEVRVHRDGEAKLDALAHRYDVTGV